MHLFFEEHPRTRKYLRFIAPGVQIATAIVATVLALTKTVTPVEAAILGTLFILLENVAVLIILRESVIPFVKEMTAKHILLRHQEIALSNWILREEYTRLVTDFSRRISDLGSGHFTLQLHDVPRLSLEVIQSLENEGFATAVVGYTDQFFDTMAGKQYLSACYDAAKRITGTFTRIFVIRDFVDITPRLYDIIEEHTKEGINVLVAKHDELISNNLDPQSDFGVWDRLCLMQMRATPGALSAELDIQVGGPKVDTVIKESRRWAQVATKWAEFKDEFCKPLNPEWLDLLPRFRSFPPPAGPSRADVERMWTLVCGSEVRQPTNVLVLGYTEKIVEHLVEKGCPRIDILDIGVFQPLQYAGKVSFFQGNWLTWSQPEGIRYDTIVGDDILNNLGVWQYHIFFRKMSALLRPSGTLVMRQTGQYGKRRVQLPGFETTLNELKKKTPVTEDLLIAKLWPMFHSPEFYDSRTRSFDLQEWNRRLRQAEPSAFAANGDMTTLRLDYPIKQTSLPVGEILRYAGPWFDLIEELPADETYTGVTRDFVDYYRILCFRQKP